MNYLQIARETLSVESQALAQLSQRLDDEFSQVVDHLSLLAKVVWSSVVLVNRG